MQGQKFISQSFWTIENLKSSDLAEQIVNLMATRDDEFRPTVFYAERFTKRKNETFSLDKIPVLLEAITSNDINYIVLTNSERKKQEFSFGFSINMLKKFSVLNFEVTRNYFDKPQCNLERFIKIGFQIAGIVNPIYGEIHDVADANYIMGDEVFNVLVKIPAAFWGNYFGERYIEKIGRDRLLQFKGYRVEELVNGNIFVQTTESPLNPGSTEDRRIQREFAKIIGVKSTKKFINSFNNLFE